MKTQKNLSVYVVDDDKMFVTALTHKLEKFSNTSIHSFETGEQCLETFMDEGKKIIPERVPDILILDYYLNSTYPEAMNGMQVLKKVLRAKPETKVIMLSVQDNMDVAVDTIKNGAYDYIIKNDKVFLRARHVVSNATKAVIDHENLKLYKLWSRLIIGGLLALITIGIVLETNFSNGF